jgi:hypothetical protein
MFRSEYKKKTKLKKKQSFSHPPGPLLTITDEMFVYQSKINGAKIAFIYLTGMERPEEVCFDCDSCLLGEGRRGRILVGNAGIVHQDIQSAIGGLDMIAEFVNILLTGDIQLVILRVQT